MNMAEFNFGHIEDVFMFVSGGPAFENEAFLDKETGMV
jgi:hypothetical protein